MFEGTFTFLFSRDFSSVFPGRFVNFDMTRIPAGKLNLNWKLNVYLVHPAFRGTVWKLVKFIKFPLKCFKNGL